MTQSTMCHHTTNYEWSHDAEEKQEEEEPSFPEKEPAEDVEILTDGGDEDQ